MSITPQTLVRVAEATAVNSSLASLRLAFPGVHFTECAADDINARTPPALETEDFAFYLVSSPGGYCLEITAEFESATGIVVAAKDED